MPPSSARAAPILAAAALAAHAVCASAAGVTSGDPQARLDVIESSLAARRAEQSALERRAGDLAAEIDELREQLVDAAAAVQDFELRLHRQEDDLALLEARIEEARGDLALTRGGLAATLGALVLIARHPPEALLVRPGKWSDTVHGVRLLEQSATEFGERTIGLAEDLAALRALRAEQTSRQAALVGLRTDVADRRAVLRQLLERKSSLQATLMADRRNLARDIGALGAQARDVRDLIEVIRKARAEISARRSVEHHALAEAAERSAAEVAEADRLNEIEPVASPAITAAVAKPDPPAPRPAEGARRLAALPEVPTGSSLPYPVHGDIVRRFGEARGAGEPSQGLGIAARAGAEVVAPRAGEVVFAGPFRSYGQLLILEHAGGYHTLLSGFSRLHCEVGQRVRAGEPVGRMAEDAGEATILYVEIRHNSQPIDPVPWLMSGSRKVSG